MKTSHQQFTPSRIYIVLSILIGLIFYSNTNLGAKTFWTQNNNSAINETATIKTSQQNIFDIDFRELSSILNSAAKEFSGESTVILSLPMPTGNIEDFYVYESPVMEDGLAQKFPGIKTYSIIHQTNPSFSGRIDVTHKGFHAIIFSTEGTIYIDPINSTNTAVAKSYFKRDFIGTEKAASYSCTVLGEDSEIAKRIDRKVRSGIQRPSGAELRTYRLAVAATGEYTTFHGGTVADGLAAIVTTLNRVVGVYERELAIRMVLVANNDLIIYTNGATDPLNNNATGTLIDQSQIVCDANIGSANYDVGHVFSTGAGGLAQLGVPCDNANKARGVTGINSPVGDPFDIDYVAHELGHQFGAGHTFNGSSGSCGGNIGGQAYEPGSGTTIMAYAGICTPQNIQNNSDAYFHGASYDQIIAYSTLSDGNDCAVITATGNTPPEVGVLEGGFIIPKSTPFELTGNATDADNDPLLYQWEQFDLGPQGAPNLPTGNAPIFRSFFATTSPTRVFPRIEDLIGTPTLGEILPNYARNLKFRFNARDNRLGGGGVDHDFIDLTVEGNAGPFLVTNPNTALTFEVNEVVDITWDVANTDVPPVDCQNVDIFLSVDGGFTYPIILTTNVPNSGSAMVTMPNQITASARVKVKAADNVFFDISNTVFSIVAPTNPDFFLGIPNNTTSVCTPDDATYSIDVEGLTGFSSNVLLEITNPPAGATINFSNNNFVPTQNSTLTISNTSALADGTYTLDLQVSGNGITRNKELILNIYNSVPNAIALTSPADAATAQGLQQSFTWSSSVISTDYDFELATDMAFTNIIYSATSASSNLNYAALLTASTTYYWRVRGNNTCGNGNYSTPFSFTTDGITCTTYMPSDLPIDIATFPITITSTLNVIDNYQIVDVNILNLTGEHTWISDLDGLITSPDGTVVDLFLGPCDDEDDWDISFDDAAANSVLPCPMTDGNTYKPKGSLADFYGKNVQGDWILTIRDNFNQDGGELSTWALEVCQLTSTNIPAPSAPTNLMATAISNSEIDLEWSDNAVDETGFILERSLTSATGFTTIANLGANVTTYNDMGLNQNTTYFYRVKATNAIVNSVNSNEAEATTFDLLATIASDLDVIATSTSTIDVSWVDNSENELGFVVARSKDNNSNYNIIDTTAVNIESYMDMELASGTVYFYKVAPYNAIGLSDYSNEKFDTTDLETSIIDIALDQNTSIFPNPTTDIINITINHQARGKVVLRLYDSAGKKIIGISDQKNSEIYANTIDVKSLPNGNYILEIRIDDISTFRKINKQ